MSGFFGKLNGTPCPKILGLLQTKPMDLNPSSYKLSKDSNLKTWLDKFKSAMNDDLNTPIAFSVLFNLGVLGFFKYFNFFIDSWIDLFATIGYELESK